MSLATITASPGDFDEWEYELDQPRRVPSKAARRRDDHTVIDRQLGISRHRSHEREV